MDAQMAINEVSKRDFRILKDISISPNKYIYDLSYANNSKINVAVETKDDSNYLYSGTCGTDINFFAYIASYISSGEIVFSLDRTIKKTYYNRETEECIWFPSHLLNGYIPHGIARTRSNTGRLLICLWNHKPRKLSQGKVWKVNASTKKISEYEYDKSKPLFKCPTYISENGNGDICVSDEGAVVVLSEVGMLRFRYKGLAEARNFDPYGICTDFSWNIIIADMKNDKIHMIDENGGFVCYIQYENMEMPRALCVGQDNKLYVGEWKSGLIKVLSLT